MASGNLHIISKHNPILHEIAHPVNMLYDSNNLIETMWEIMYKNHGIGLAAPQLGESVRVIVVHADNFKQAFINPIITRKYGGTKNSKEGCLTYPELSKIVTRYKRIVVEGFDVNHLPIKRKLHGLAATVVQHEVDHLNGITIG